MNARAKSWLAILIAAGLVSATTPAWAADQTAPSAARAQQVLKHSQPLAEQGDASAQYNLGVLYDRGYGVERDYEKARQWYEKAAAQHYARAEHNLGIMYESGKGVPRDFEKAAKWFRRGAEDGQAASQNNLAVLYMKGQGVAQNTGKAAFWAARAAAGGNSAAIDNLPRIVADLPHVHVNADSVNVRDQPDGEARVVGQLDSDIVAVVLSRRDGWTQILVPDSYTQGWVADTLLSATQAPLRDQNMPGSTSADQRDSESDGKGGKSTTPERSPERATADAERPETPPRKPAGQPASGAKAAPDETSAPAQAESGTARERATIGVGTANMRGRAARNARVIGQLHRGDEVEIQGTQNGWRHVRTSKGMTGWIAGYLLTH